MKGTVLLGRQQQTVHESTHSLWPHACLSWKSSICWQSGTWDSEVPRPSSGENSVVPLGDILQSVMFNSMGFKMTKTRQTRTDIMEPPKFLVHPNDWQGHRALRITCVPTLLRCYWRRSWWINVYWRPPFAMQDPSPWMMQMMTLLIHSPCSWMMEVGSACLSSMNSLGLTQWPWVTDMSHNSLYCGTLVVGCIILLFLLLETHSHLKAIYRQKQHGIYLHRTLTIYTTLAVSAYATLHLCLDAFQLWELAVGNSAVCLSTLIFPCLITLSSCP